MCRVLKANADLLNLIGLPATWLVTQLGDRNTMPAMARSAAALMLEGSVWL